MSTAHSRNPQVPEKLWPRKSGVIVEDYTDLIETGTQGYGRDWALPRRYAVALDEGGLVFRDGHDLEPEHSHR